MNNLSLSFSGAELTRLRTLVADVGKAIGLVPGGNATTEGDTPRTALDKTWSHLVEMLDLGAEPEMRECQECKRLSAAGATRCGHCWAVLPRLESSKKLTT